MKKIYFSLLVAGILFCNTNSHAQTDPGTTNLTHQWTFDDGTAKDNVGMADGTLQGTATISNKALNTTSGGYLSFTGSALGVNAYTALTTEVWFKSSSGQNTGNTMLTYFGDANVSGWMGTNYIFSSPSNGSNCRLAISTGNTTSPWTAETGINRAAGAIDDGLLHQLVCVITATNITMYVDGVSVGTATLSSTNKLSAVSTANAFLCKSGYTSDPTWKGYVNKYSLYNKALSSDEVLFLYQKGAEASTSIDASVSSFSFDETYKSGSFAVTGSNLTNSITITAPTGITVSPATLASNASNATVTVTYDGSTAVDGNITLTSGSTVWNIPVKASVNSSCFTPLYTTIPNLITDPYMNSIPGSWGSVSLVTGSDVYCGSHCVKISGTATCSGSVDTKSFTWIPNATYRIHAKVKTLDGSFNMGIQNANVGGASGDYNIAVPNTNGVWTDFDATFTTGAASTTGMVFFNNCGSSTGLTGYIDNWELYAIPGISTSTASIALDKYIVSSSFTVTGVNLTQPITLTAPAGVTLDQTSLAANVSGVTVHVTYDGTTSVNGNIALTSGSYSKNITVKSYSNSSYTPLYPNATNLIPDPLMTSLTNFTSTGTTSLNTDPAFSYSGVSSGKVTNSGSIIKYLTGVMKPNTTYRVKAKVYKCNPGSVTYTLDVDQVAHPTEYALIKTALDSACALFNKYTPLSANIYVYYNAGIPTAQASNYGSIGFGASTSYMWVGTTIHEMDHYFGSGTNATWKSHVVSGAWNGTVANNLLKQINNDPSANISSDGTHFWPYGINYRSEIENLGGHDAQLQGLINAVKIAKAMIVDDAGLGTNKNPVGIGVSGWNGSAADIYKEVTTPGAWQNVDFTFTTGTTLGASPSVYFNSGSGYIDNWEMYEVPPAVMTSVPYLSLDELNPTGSFKVTGANLSGGAISLTAPAGITLSASSLPNTAVDSVVTVTYDGKANSTGFVTLNNGSVSTNVRILATRNIDSFTPLYANATNLIGDTYLNSISNFGGWGNHIINTDTLYVYGGSRSGKVWGTNGGSLDKVLTGVLKANTKYEVRAKVYIIGGTFQFGIYGWSGSSADYTKSISAQSGWQTVDFQFTTGATLGSTQGIFFNNYGLTGQAGYIDNWEMYDLSTVSAVNVVKQQNQRIYAVDNDIVSEFELDKESDVQIAVYDMQGKLLVKRSYSGESGYNRNVIEAPLPKGIYLVKVTSDEFSVSKKIIR
ncbi:LamG-like jellyroll fold domain-containing protein [Parabacteroides sp. FAFU027]|uniref:LamG-like jellyroll fold domain-containing protein n=1 Tax=Parabacteroides sp. FAFU027 TaxID=2922715 RepID=UPI001FB02998|nr:LamG-like jellyroll fold domain-containing protein [Parabacteroides sp. FAFU027]